MPRTLKEIESLATIDPELATAIEQIGPLPDITQYAPKDIRLGAKLRARQLAGADPAGLAHILTEDITIPARDQHPIPAKVYRPATAGTGQPPLLVIFHGGGYVLGGLENEELACRNYVKELGFIAVNVDYRLAPEYPFPIGVMDAWDAVRWAAANAIKLGADPRRGFIIGGTSAGANFTDVVVHLARDEKLSPPLTGELLIIPALIGDPRKLSEPYLNRHISQVQNEDAPILGRKESQYFMEHYKPDRLSHLHRPFFWPTGHTGLPPVSIHACGMDPLRDDALCYEEALQEAGVKTRLYVAPGVPHGFTSMFPQLKVAERFVADTLEGLRWLLQVGDEETVFRDR